MKTAQAFLEKLQNDQTFAAQLSDQVAGAPDRVAAVCAAARTLGYDVAPEQLTSLLDSESEDISEEELSQVSGGFWIVKVLFKLIFG